MPAKTLTDAQANRLINFYADAEREILNAINRALMRSNQTEYLIAMRDNVRAILKDLRAGSRTWCEEAIPRLYSRGMIEANVQLQKAGVDMKAYTGFAAIHQQAAQQLAEAAYDRFDGVATTIGRRVDDIYRTLALENVRGSVIGYESWGQVARNYRNQLAERGVTGFKDRVGREWNMRSYSEMVARTTTMECHLEGTKNRLLERDRDLVIISSHYNPCAKCAPWEGQIVSLTGKTPSYPTMEEAKAVGLFHPNCRHTFGLYIED